MQVSLKGRFLDLDLRCGKENICSALMGRISEDPMYTWLEVGLGEAVRRENLNYFYALKVAGTYSLSMLHNYFSHVLDIWENIISPFIKTEEG